MSRCPTLRAVPGLYSLVSLTLCVDDSHQVLMVQESRADCRGLYYVPAASMAPGEDPVALAPKITAEKSGLDVRIDGILGIEHHLPMGQYPGQIRVYLAATPVRGKLKCINDNVSMGAIWVASNKVQQLKLRLDDFMPWLDDWVLGRRQPLDTSLWKMLGAGVYSSTSA